MLSVLVLLLVQVGLGLLSVHYELNQPFLTISHQLVAALLVALLSAITFRRPNASLPNLSEMANKSLLGFSHG